MGLPGTAHALEHMLFRSSKSMTGSQLDEMIGKMGAGMNAFTTNDATQFYFSAPARFINVLLHIEATRMRGADLSDSEWSIEKGAIEQEVSRDISDPDFLAFAKAERILFHGTGYAETPLGSRPTFDRTKSSDIRKFYDSWYRPNNAVLVVVGDIDPVVTVNKVKQLFGSIERGELPTRAPTELEPFKPQIVRQNTPDRMGSVGYYYRMPGERSTDYAAMQVLLGVLNNARSPLSRLAADGKVLAAAAQSQRFEHGGVVAVRVGFPKGGDSKKARRELNEVIRDILKNGVSVDLVNAAKRHEQARFEFSRNSASRLASAWSQALAWRGLDSPQQGLDQILAVTPQDVDRVARKYLKSDQRITVVMTPSQNGERPPGSQGFGGTEQFAGNNKLTVPLPPWAANPLAKLDMPRWTLKPVRMKLDNGITLIVQPETISNTVTVVGHVDSNAGIQEPKGQEGVGKLLDSLFDYGTVRLDRVAFHKALDDIAASESGGSNFKLRAPSAYFDQGMQLLADNEMHPALPQKAFTVQQKALSRKLVGELQSPRHKLLRSLWKGLLPPGDPSLRQATPATVNRLTLAEAKAYFKRVYRPDMTTIVVVGNVTPAQAKAEVEKTFGAWKATGPKPGVIPKPVPLNPAVYTVVPNSYASQDTVLMAQMLDLDLHSPARYALQLGNEVLGGNGFASRLMMAIRVNHGYAYGAGSGLQFDRARSYFFVTYASDPSKVKPVDGLVYQNLEQMRNTPVTPSELTNSKQAQIRSIPRRISSVNSIAGHLLVWGYQGEPLNQPMIAAKHYLELTAQQVQEAFKRYIKPTNLVQVVQGPEPKEH